jgi:hypothetical protein
LQDAVAEIEDVAFFLGERHEYVVNVFFDDGKVSKEDNGVEVSWN